MSNELSVARNDPNVIALRTTYSITLELDEIDPATNDDEATLKADDDSYEKTLKIAEEGVWVDDDHLRLWFTGVLPGKTYTLTYDLKTDADGNELGSFNVFEELLIRFEDLNTDQLGREDDVEETEGVEFWEAFGVDKDEVEEWEEPDPDEDDEPLYDEVEGPFQGGA